MRMQWRLEESGSEVVQNGISLSNAANPENFPRQMTKKQDYVDVVSCIVSEMETTDKGFYCTVVFEAPRKGGVT